MKPLLRFLLGLQVLVFSNLAGAQGRLVAEWETPRRLVLVWPEGLAGRESLVPFCRALIKDSMVPNLGACTLTLITGSERTARSLKSEIKALSPEVWVIPEVRDIWIRDWAPLPLVGSDGRRGLAKALYAPRYLDTPALKRSADRDDRAGRELTKRLGLPLVEIPLTWDGGNLAHNGHGVALVSNRIIADNESRSMDEIRGIFREKLGIAKLIFLPVEPGDDTGHVDGLVQFLDEHTLALAEYPESYAEGRKFLDGVERQLRAELGDGFRIVRVPCEEPEDGGTEIASAWGNRINFVRLPGAVLLPAYGTPGDSAATAVFKSVLPGDRIVGVSPPKLRRLARLGGLLHCISVTY
jgi:agmatine deiminase